MEGKKDAEDGGKPHKKEKFNPLEFLRDNEKDEDGEQRHSGSQEDDLIPKQPFYNMLKEND